MLNRNQSFDYDSTLTQEKNSNLMHRILRKLILEKSSNRCLSTNVIVVRVDDEDYYFDNDKLSQIIPNYSKFLKKESKETNIRNIVLPNWIERTNFDQYIVSVTKKVSNYDLNTSRKLIQISNYLCNFPLIKTILSDCIIPNVTKHTCLRILLEYYENLSSNLSNDFLPLIQYCIETASKNIYFLINNQSEELSIIKDETLEEIIERYFELVSLNLNIDHSIIMRLLIKIRKLTDIFELLENERKKCISFFEMIMCENVEPTIIWKIKNEDPQKGFYKESDEFPNENLNKVIISYYDHHKDIFNIALRINSVSLNKQETINEESQSNVNDPSIIFSILSIVEIPEINFKSNTNFNCVFNNSKIKILLCKIDNFSKMFDLDFKTCKHLEFSMKIYFQINYNFSAILTHISKNFYEYYSLNSLSKISKNVFNIILKNKKLNIRNEDEVLFAVTNYINNKQSTEGLLDLFNSVNWRKISLEAILEFILNESKLLLNSPNLNDLIINEFNFRFKSQFRNKEELFRAKTPTNNLTKHETYNEDMPKTSDTQVMFPFTSELILNLIKIAQRNENQPKHILYSHNVSSTASNSTTHINSSLSNKNNNPKCASRNSKATNNEDIKFPSSKQRINTSQESIDISSNYNKRITKKIEENLKCEGLSIDHSGYSTHRRLTSNLSFNNVTQERRYKNESSVKNDLINNYNSLNCNMDFTKIEINSPKAEKTVNLQKKFTNKLNFKKENSFDIKQKFTNKLINKMKQTIKTESKCDLSNNTNINLHINTQQNSSLRKVDKKTIKNEIFKNDQQSLVISRNSSIKMKKLNAKNSGLIFVNSEEINSSSNNIKKNDITTIVKFKQNTNFITKLQTLK